MLKLYGDNLCVCAEIDNDAVIIGVAVNNDGGVNKVTGGFIQTTDA
ncbi:MAG: hypothetical protein JJU41_05005 [Bacteroidetes bacterium]|nr:hypothetical protein [Bacteroidota bacterium]